MSERPTEAAETEQPLIFKPVLVMHVADREALR